MIVGKVSENILNRSVFKLFRHRRKEIVKKPSIGDDGTYLKIGDDGICITTNPVVLPLEELGKKAIYYVGNNIACMGAEFVGVMVNVLLPAYSDEKDIKIIMNDLEDIAGKLNIEVMGGHTQMLDNVNKPMLVLTGVGKTRDNKTMLDKIKDIQVGYDIIMTKWAGMEGASLIAKNNKDKLLTKYKEELVDNAVKLEEQISVMNEANIAYNNGALYMHDVTSSGVYAGLWELSCGVKHGIEVDLQAIPIRQEIVEVCEFFDINPYLLDSKGVLLIVAKNGDKLIDEYEKVGIEAAIIGKIANHNNKIVRNFDEMRYLDPPKPYTYNL